MKWEVEYLPEAIKDIKKLDNSNRLLVRKAIQKVSSILYLHMKVALDILKQLKKNSATENC